jgi:hypothetical protein
MVAKIRSNSFHYTLLSTKNFQAPARLAITSRLTSQQIRKNRPPREFSPKVGEVGLTPAINDNKSLRRAFDRFTQQIDHHLEKAKLRSAA